jgi:hypothetical protein
MRWVFILGFAQAAYVLAIAWELNFGSTDAEAVHIDFVAFWSAARLALGGNAMAAFDPDALVSAQSLGSEAIWEAYVWHYPPTFHMIIAPLGLLPFTPAFALFSALGLAAYVWAVRLWCPERLALTVVAPPVVFVLLTGNTTLLWVAALLAALRCIGNPVLSGALIALLTIKPQLGVLIPVALVFGRHWSVIGWASLWTIALVATSAAVFGVSYWMTFFSHMSGTVDLFGTYGENAVTMVTWYAFSRQIGLGHDAAIGVQIVFLFFAAAAVALAWAEGNHITKKVAVLCLAILISTPYAFEYELVLAVVAAVMVPWLLPLWALPLPAWLIGGVEMAQYAAPVLTVGLLMALFWQKRALAAA